MPRRIYRPHTIARVRSVLACSSGGPRPRLRGGHGHGVPAACRDATPEEVLVALEAAPGEVRLSGTPLSDCFNRNANPGDVQAVGAVLIEVAENLADEARERARGRGGHAPRLSDRRGRAGCRPHAGDPFGADQKAREHQRRHRHRDSSYRRGLERRSRNRLVGCKTCRTNELWGGETAKAVENFPVSGERVPVPVIRWLGRIKAAAARTNAELGLLDQDIADRIAEAGDAVGARRARRPVPDRRLPDRLRHLVEHERQRGAGEHRRRGRPPQRPREHGAVLERRVPLRRAPGRARRVAATS